MAIAIPVLEKSDTTEKDNVYVEKKKAETEHNSHISDNYAKLITPGVGIDDFLGRSVVKPVPADILNYSRPAAESATSNVSRPYLVENARATADIFRADSAVNARPAVQTVLSQAVAAPQAPAYTAPQTAMPVMSDQAAEEEENEDLRPTQTTIQYKTSISSLSDEEGKIENRATEKRFTLSRKDKAVIGVIVGVIVALFTLIIVNSVIISGINKDIQSIQSSIVDVREEYDAVNSQISDYIENIEEAVDQYALENNMVKTAE